MFQRLHSLHLNENCKKKSSNAVSYVSPNNHLYFKLTDGVTVNVAEGKLLLFFKKLSKNEFLSLV